jgi:hypothetical protein
MLGGLLHHFRGFAVDGTLVQRLAGYKGQQKSRLANFRSQDGNQPQIQSHQSKEEVWIGDERHFLKTSLIQKLRHFLVGRANGGCYAFLSVHQ